MDEARLKEARKTRANMRERLAGGSTDMQVPDEFLSPRTSRPSRASPAPDRRRGGNSREDEDMRRAIEESKRMAENDSGRSRPPANDGDKDLEEALRLSREEDENRRRMTESSSKLFDEERCVGSSACLLRA